MNENKEVETEVKEEKPKKKRNIIIRIFDIIVWLVVFCWMCTWIVDYFNIANEKEAMFCLETKTETYDDGTVTICKGPGYNAYHYDRDSLTGYAFIPFWAEDYVK